ncbi:hypothetical protein T484DRAFT_1972783 [Baffinella frigidus]|nr:hypothetical protein T484DRAFT_1972783 [Cryptophyta sp. CCMP2293]
MSRSTARTAACSGSKASVVGSRAASPRGALRPGRSAFALTAVVQLLLWQLGGGDARVPTAMVLGTRSGWGGVSVRFVGSAGGSTGVGGKVSNGPDGRLRGGGREGSRNPGVHPRQLTSWIKECKDVGGLLGLLERHDQSFNCIHVCAAWCTLAKIRSGGGRGADGVVMRLQVLTRATEQAMGTREVSNVVHSLAKCMRESGRMAVDHELVGVLLRRATGMVGDFNPQDISNFMWALATMDVKPDASLLEAMQGRARATAGDFKPQEVTNLMWALATMGIENPDAGLVKMMQRRARMTAGDFKPQEVTNLMWALATMGIENPDAGLVKMMQRRARATAGDFKPQEVANLVWALATMGVKADAGLLEAMQGHATATAGDFKPQEVANLVWALATMGVKADAGLLEAMQGHATATAGDFTPQNLSNLAWALATMGIEPDAGLLEAMQRRATVTADDFDPQNDGNLLWALACFDTSPSQVSVLMVESMAVRLLSMREQLRVEAMRQIHQWLLFCDLHPAWRQQLPRSMQKVKEELGGGFRQAFESAPVHPSHLQADVAKQLRRSLPELEFEEEFVDPTSGYSIDIRAERSGAGNALGCGSMAGRGWAVEVDGPTHFLQGGSERAPTGSTLLKRRQLAQLGYKAVSVPYWEWRALKGKGKEQHRYLRGKLRIDQVPPPVRPGSGMGPPQGKRAPRVSPISGGASSPSSLPDGKGLPECAGGMEDGKGGEGKLGWRSSRLKRFTKRVGGERTMGVPRA